MLTYIYFHEKSLSTRATRVGAAFTRLCALNLYFLFIYLFWKDNSSGIIIQSCTVCAPRRRSWWGWGFASGQHCEWHLLVRGKCILLHSAEALLHLHVNQAVGLIPKAPLTPARFDSFIRFSRRRKSDTCPSSHSLILVPEKQQFTLSVNCCCHPELSCLSTEAACHWQYLAPDLSCCSDIGVDWLALKVGV